MQYADDVGKLYRVNGPESTSLVVINDLENACPAESLQWLNGQVPFPLLGME
jgi:hypothetical protein